jgi:hypothetical protein
MMALNENLETLKTRLDAPCLGLIPWMGEQHDQNLSAGLLSIDVLANQNTQK